MLLYHGTSTQHLPAIRRNGVLRSDHGEWGNTICAMDSFEKARRVARYFGRDGVVLQLQVPDEAVRYHPDYGHGSEFDTIHIDADLPPSSITKVIPVGVDLPNDLIRPHDQPLRQWKGDQDDAFRKRLDATLDSLDA